MQNYTWPPGFATATNPSVGTNGAAIPLESTLIASKNPSGNLTPAQSDSNGYIYTNVQASSLPTGAATAANQVTGNTSLATIATNTTGLNNTVTTTGSAVPTEAIQVGVKNGANLVALSEGQSTMANSLPVVVASDQTVPVIQNDTTASGSITSTQSVTIAINSLATVGISVTGTWTGTLAVEASVDGVNFNSTTAAFLASGQLVSNITSNAQYQASTAGMASFRIRGNTVASGTAVIAIRASQGAAMVMLDNPIPAGSATIGAVNQAGTWNITNITGTVSLPTGAATSALQTSGNTSLSTIATNTTGLNLAIAATSTAVPADAIQIGVKSGPNLVPITEGQATMANSLPVAIASDQSAIPVSQSGSWTVASTQSGTWSTRTQDGSGNAVTSHLINSNRGLDSYQLGFVQGNAPVFNDYTSTAITTAAYVQLIASTTSTTQEIEIFDSSGQALYLATGAAASEVNQIIITPGGNGRVKLSIPSGTRVSAKAITATANTGFLAINLYA